MSSEGVISWCIWAQGQKLKRYISAGALAPLPLVEPIIDRELQKAQSPLFSSMEFRAPPPRLRHSCNCLIVMLFAWLGWNSRLPFIGSARPPSLQRMRKAL